MAENCWTLTYADGTDLDTGDAQPCYQSEEEALDDRGRYISQTLGVPQARQRTEPCVVATCGCCSTSLGEEEEGQAIHFPEDELEAGAVTYGWKRVGDEWRCESCLTGECDDCRKDLAVSRG